MQDSNAEKATCRFGTALEFGGKTYKNCIVKGHADGGTSGTTYYASCEGLSPELQIEFNADGTAQLLNSSSRGKIADCSTKPAELAAAIQDYQERRNAIENPKCYLTQKFGRTMFVANGVRGSCSMTVDPKKAKEFQAKTGMAPALECESDHFIILEQSGPARIYARGKAGWDKLCDAALRTTDSADSMDWKAFEDKH